MPMWRPLDGKRIPETELEPWCPYVFRRASIARAKRKSPRESMAARGRRRQGLGVSDSGTFHDRVNTVCRNILKRLDGAVRPADLHGFHFFGGAKAEVEA